MTERVVACINDDRAVVGPDGFATFVVSAPNERPANATAACGVNWLAWGPNVRGALIYRNMLPDAGFGASVQRAKPDAEAQTIGDGFPASRYYADAAAYQALGCARAGRPPIGPRRDRARPAAHRRQARSRPLRSVRG
jgi:hypothetical protein